MLCPSRVCTSRWLPNIHTIAFVTNDLVRDTLPVAGSFPPVVHTKQSILLHCRSFNGLDLCNIFFKLSSAFSTTPTLNRWLRTSRWYSFCNCDPGVAGTKITDSLPFFLYQFTFFLVLSFSRSSMFQPLGRYIGLSPLACSASSIALYAIRAESITSYLNFLVYPDNCIRSTTSSTCLTTTSHGTNLLQCSITLNTSCVNTVLFIWRIASRSFITPLLDNWLKTIQEWAGDKKTKIGFEKDKRAVPD
jgi:hypothetical protein